MRVVWVTHNYPRYPGDPAGAFLHPLALALRARDVDVQVVAPSDAGQGGDAELDGVPVTRVRYASARSETLGYGGMAGVRRLPGGLLILNRLRRSLRAGARGLLDTGGEVLVHAHWWLPAGLAAPAEVPLVLTCHGTDVRMLERAPLLARVARPVFRRARVVTTVSRVLAETIRRITGVGVAPDAVQPMPVTPVERPISDRSGGVVVLGRLTEQKRVGLALDAFAIARGRGLTLPMIIVGDGPARAALEARASAADLRDTVLFKGTVAPAEVPACLANAAAVVMPAKAEGFGLAEAEELIQGVPVVACSDGGGLDDIVPPTGAGRLTAPEPAAIASALVEVLADPDAGAAARAEGERWRERLSPERVADHCLDWYHRALHA